MATLQARIEMLKLESRLKDQAIKTLEQQRQRERSSDAAQQQASEAGPKWEQQSRSAQELPGDARAAADEVEAARVTAEAAVAELAAEREFAAEAARARAEELKRWAAAADKSAAELASRITDLEAEREAAKRTALAELTTCRDAGMQAVFELEAQVAELATQKAALEQANERLQAEVERQRTSLSKNRVIFHNCALSMQHTLSLLKVVAPRKVTSHG
jgi:chromosome segregation ATPase